MSSYSSTNYSINGSSEYSSHYYTPSDYTSLKQNRYNNNSTFDLTSLEYTTGQKTKSASPLKMDQRVHLLPGTDKNSYQIPIPALLMKPPMISNENRARNSQFNPGFSPPKNTTLSYISTASHNSISPVSNQSSTFSSMNSPTRSNYSSNATSDYAEEKSSPYSRNVLSENSPFFNQERMSPLYYKSKHTNSSQQSFRDSTEYLANKKDADTSPRISDSIDLTNSKAGFKRIPKKLPEEPKLTFEDKSTEISEPLSNNSNERISRYEKFDITQDENEAGSKSQKSISPILSEYSFDANSNYRMNQTAKRLIDESTFDFNQLVQLNQSVDAKPNPVSTQSSIQDGKKETKEVEKIKKKHKFWFFGLRKKFSDKPVEPVNIFTKREVPIENLAKEDIEEDFLNDLINGDNDVEVDINITENKVTTETNKLLTTSDISMTSNKHAQSPNVISFMNDRKKYNSYISNQSYSASISSSISCCEEMTKKNFGIKNSSGIIIFSSNKTETPIFENQEQILDSDSLNKDDEDNDELANIQSLESENLTLLSKRNTRLRKSGLAIREKTMISETEDETLNYKNLHKEPSNTEMHSDNLESDEEVDTTERYSPINENISFFENSPFVSKTDKLEEDKATTSNFEESIRAYTDSIKNYTSSFMPTSQVDGETPQARSDDLMESDDEFLKDINNDYSVVETLKETSIKSQINEVTMSHCENEFVCGDDSSFYGDEGEVTKRLVVTPTFHPSKNSFLEDDSPYSEFIKDIIPTYGFPSQKEFAGDVNGRKNASISMSLKVPHGNNPIKLGNDIQDKNAVNLMMQDRTSRETESHHPYCDSRENFGAIDSKAIDSVKSNSNDKHVKEKSRDFSFATSICSDVEFQQNIGSFAEIKKNNYLNSQRQIQARMPSIADSVIYFKESDLVHQPYESKDAGSDWETVEGNSRVSSITSNESTLLSAVNSLYKDYITCKGYKNIQEMCINNEITLPAAIRQIKIDS